MNWDSLNKEILSFVDIEQFKYQQKELTAKSQDPNFYKNIDYKDVLSRLDKIQTILEIYNTIKEDFDLLLIAQELNENLEVDKLSNQIETLKNNLFSELKQANESQEYKGCYLKIVAGAGGTESCDFAGMLMRMYILYCAKHNWNYTITNMDDDHCIAGIKTCTILIHNKEAYNKLKYESGVHRLVRPSPFNALNKRMTSFVSIFIYPQIEEQRIENLVILDVSKLSFDYFRCSGAGGQNVNKVNSGVRARYIYTDPETGEDELILVENTETRDQPKNKENAINNLKSILYAKYKAIQNKEKDAIEANKKSIEWGSQIRSYVLDDGRVKDHRTDYVSNSPDKILNGDIDDMLSSEINFFEIKLQCQHI